MIKKLLTESLKPHPQNPRKNLGDFKELANSIKTNGVYQNLTVVDNYDGTYTIIIGYRRHAAAKLAGVTELPCAVVEMTEKEQLETMLLENMQRSDLTVYEQAQGFQMLIDLGSSVEEVAKETGFSKSTIYKRTKLLELDQEIFKETQARNVNLEDYAKLNQLNDPENKNAALKVIGTRNFNDTLLKLKKQEKDKEALTKIKDFLDGFAKPIPESQLGDGYSYERYFSSSSANNLVVPEDAKPGKYVYTDNSGSFYLYKKGKNTAAKRKTKEEKERERREAEFEAKAKELDGRVRTLIYNFVKKYRAKFHARFIELFKLYVQNVLLSVDGHNTSSYVDMKRIAELYDMETSKSYPYTISKADADLMCDDFIRLILSLLYTNVNSYGYLFIDSQKQHYMPRSVKVLYKALEICGYEMSDEEYQYFMGTHEIFRFLEDKEE